MDIEYYVEASQAKEQKLLLGVVLLDAISIGQQFQKVVLLLKDVVVVKSKIGELVSSILKLIFLWSEKLKQL